jgi:phenylpropionate dioxygenase-like ring-hydroxylating dioxygenase large terminal subunit
MTTVSKMGSPDLAQILAKTRDADAGGLGALSTGEALAAALVLNRPDWLAAMNYTIAEAIERVGPEWIRLIPAAAKQFNRESEEAAYETAEKARQAKLAEFTARRADDKTIDCSATFVTSGNAPGYRDVSLTFDLRPIGDNRTMRTTVRIRPEDGETVVREITDVHRFAWRNGAPIDAKPDEQRPRWIDGR